MFTVYGHTGVVGRQLYRWLERASGDVAGISLDERIGQWQERPEWAFLCLPTPTDEDGQNLDAIYEVCWQLASQEIERVVIRSTVLPGTTASLQETFRAQGLWFWHWPEFLSARTAFEDFSSPILRVVGCPDCEDGRRLWREQIEPLLPDPCYSTQYVSTTMSEALKYVHNTHGAMQVIFANLMYDMCHEAGISWEELRKLVPELCYVSSATERAYWNVWKDGRRGYGGACFPKDVKALLLWLQQRTGKAPELLLGMERANALLNGTAKR